jgi:hypothetical protein
LSTDTRAFIAVVTVFFVQLLVWSSVLFYVRRQTYRSNYGTWLQTFTAYFVQSLLLIGVCLVPCGGPFFAFLLYFLGIKRISGVGFMPAFALTLGVSFLLLIAGVMIGAVLGVEKTHWGR